MTVTSPSNWRSHSRLEAWLIHHNLPGISGVDTRALTQYIRDNGAPKGVICHRADGQFDIPALQEMARSWPGLNGMDLAKEVTAEAAASWEQGVYDLDAQAFTTTEGAYHVVALDFGRSITFCAV